MVTRSWLYVPGDARDKLAKAPGRGADALIVDLEDSVALAVKEQARAATAEWLTEAGRSVASSTWIRVNGHRDLWERDLAVLAGLPVAGIVVPKATHRRLTAVIDAIARRDPSWQPRVAGLVETAEGLAEIHELAGTTGLSHLGMGEADLRAELGLHPSEHEGELAPLRLAVVVASAAAGLAPPVAPTSTDFRDLDALRVSTSRLRRLGFGGRTAIHPRQVEVINEVFTPDDQEIARARDVIARHDAALGEGRGVATDPDGRMIDEPVVKAARRTLGLPLAPPEE